MIKKVYDIIKTFAPMLWLIAFALYTHVLYEVAFKMGYTKAKTEIHIK